MSLDPLHRQAMLCLLDEVRARVAVGDIRAIAIVALPEPGRGIIPNAILCDEVVESVDLHALRGALASYRPGSDPLLVRFGREEGT